MFFKFKKWLKSRNLTSILEDKISNFTIFLLLGSAKSRFIKKISPVVHQRRTNR
jgi:hypothetical protein